MADGDHKMREESVDVESRVGTDVDTFCGHQEREVTPASCPTSRASKVTENCWVLFYLSDKYDPFSAGGLLHSPSWTRLDGENMALQ